MFEIAYWRAVLRNPVALTGLAVDLLPMWAVAVWGWGAVPLVLLYWLENVVIGAFTIPRVALASVGKSGWIGLIGGIWAAALFVVHYGLFCFSHGSILLEVLGGEGSWPSSTTLVDMLGGMIRSALSFGLHMDWVLAVIVCWHAFVFARDYVLSGEWMKAEPQMESFSPYGRLIALHVGVFVVAGALEYLGDPSIGAAVLVLARAAWGVHANMRAHRSKVQQQVLAPS